MSHIIKLKQVRIKDILIINNPILHYNNHYIHFKVTITKILFFFNHSIFSEYNFISFKEHVEIIFDKKKK